MDCDICLETKKDIKRQKTFATCLFCNGHFCKECLQKSLLTEESIEIHCPGCKAAWNHEFVHKICTTSFCTKSLKTHREKVLLDSEKIRLPDTQEEAARYIAAKKYVEKYEKKYSDSKKKLNDIVEYKQFNILDGLLIKLVTNLTKKHIEIGNHHRTAICREVPHWQHCTPCMKLYLPIQDEYFKLRERITNQIGYYKRMYEASEQYRDYLVNKSLYNSRKVKQMQRLIRNFGFEEVVAEAPAAGGAAAAAPPPAAPAEKRGFVKACPVTDCRGFLSTQWKCGICDVKVCNKCHDPMVIEPHVCDADKVASVKLIAAESKPCPKCGTAISRTYGCDQMFCIGCKTPFSWRTGKIETGHIHNPHYHEWRQQLGIQGPPVGNLVCGDQPLMDELDRRSRHDTNPYKRNLYRIIALRGTMIYHFNYVLQRLQRIINIYPIADPKRILRVRYLINDIKEDEWKVALQRHEKHIHFTRSRAQIVEMFLAAFRDIIATVATATPEEMITQLNTLMLFTIEQYEAMNKEYNSTVIIASYIPVWTDERWIPPPKKEKKVKKAKKVIIEEEE